MMTPLVKMFTLGHGFMPAPIHAGAPLPRHGEQHLRDLSNKLIERGGAAARHLRGGCPLRPGRGHRPGPGGGARRPGRDRRAVRCREEGKAETIAFNLCGHGISTWPPTSATSPESLTTTSCPSRTSTGGGCLATSVTPSFRGAWSRGPVIPRSPVSRACHSEELRLAGDEESAGPPA